VEDDDEIKESSSRLLRLRRENAAPRKEKAAPRAAAPAAKAMAWTIPIDLFLLVIVGN
jgi:hypothetical protein